MHDALVIIAKSGILIGPILLLAGVLTLNLPTIIVSGLLVAAGIVALQRYEQLYPEKVAAKRRLR